MTTAHVSKAMKKILLLFLTLIITLPALARDFQYAHKGQTLTYTVIDEEAKTCKTRAGYLGSAGNYVRGSIEIPDSVSDGVNNFAVTQISEYSFYHCDRIYDVILPSSVTSIGDQAFKDCWQLSNIKISDSVKTMGNYTFTHCTSLRSITLPDSLTSIGHGVFQECYGLTSIVIPSPVKSIGLSTFSECSNLVDIKCKAIVPPTCGRYYTFGGTSDEKRKLQIYVPKSSLEAYRNTDIWNELNLTGYDLDENDFTFTYKDKTLTYSVLDEFSKTCQVKSRAWDQSINNVEGDLEIPEKVSNGKNVYTVIAIQNEAFKNNSTITSIKMPDNISAINAYAFYNCTNLTSVNMPSSLSSIEAFTFKNCKKLNSIDLPQSVGSIGYHAFYNCENLPAIEIPSDVNFIGDYAFRSCKSIESVTLPKSVNKILEGTFYLCSGLKTIKIHDVKSIDYRAFGGCGNLVEFYCLANTPPSCVEEAFNEEVDCELYIPESSVELYRKAYYWRNFPNIIGYYVPGGENESLYIQDFYVEPGEAAYMPVRLRAERDYSDFTTDVYLPEGLEAVTAEGGAIDVQFARENGSHIISATSQPDGAIRVSVKSVGKDLMASNGGDELFSIRVKANDLPNSSILPVWFRNTSFKDANYEYLFNDTNSNINNKITTNLSDVESITGAPVDFYNLQGQRIVQPEHGRMYIRVQGGKATKMVF